MKPSCKSLMTTVAKFRQSSIPEWCLPFSSNFNNLSICSIPLTWGFLTAFTCRYLTS